MAAKRPSPELLDDTLHLSLHELCVDCQVHGEFVIELVEFGVLHPRRGRSPREWQFSGNDLVRLKRALRLRRDLDVNLPGVALSLDLLDELRELRRAVAELRRD